MIAFATLFLGLVLGVQGIELSVGEGVARVEILMHDEIIVVIDEAPWSFECDFGDELVPGKLIAIARDDEGGELGRAEQWFNLPQPAASVTIALAGEDGEGVAALLAWESLAGAEPRTVRVELDGRALEVEDPQRIPLPPHDPKQLHFLRAELEFSDHVSSVAELTFGGTYLDQISSELTPIPVVSERRKLKSKHLPEAVLQSDGQPLSVVAIEQGAAQVVMIVDRSAFDTLEELSRYRYEGQLSQAERAGKLIDWASFRTGQSIRFLWPVHRRQKGLSKSYDLFPTSTDFDSDDGGLFYLLYYAGERPLAGSERLADAVAVAGLFAAGERQRRAVVLLVGDTDLSKDPSDLSLAQAQRYLGRIRVPFQIWSMKEASMADGRRDVSSLGKLRRAVEDLGRDVDRQTMLWVGGRHLPQEIRLTPEAEAAGLELAR